MEEKKELQNQDERVVEIELERLRGFVNHPFKVQADSQMIELQESIKKYGILNPLIVRPRQDGTYLRQGFLRSLSEQEPICCLPCCWSSCCMFLSFSSAD